MPSLAAILLFLAGLLVNPPFCPAKVELLEVEVGMALIELLNDELRPMLAIVAGDLSVMGASKVLCLCGWRLWI